MNSLRSFFNYRLLIILSSCFIFGCSVSDSLDSDYSKWDFSGSVVDANSNQGLSGVTITYQNTSGEKTEAKTDKNGFFFIDALPYGTRSFTFSYKKISGKDTLYYTSKTINVTSTNESSHMEGVVAGTSAVVRLSPINASLTGEFYIKDEDSGKNLPVSDVELSIVYYDTSFINLFPENLSATTDSDGRFKFKGLPADTGFILQVKSFSDKDLHYTAKDIALPPFSSFIGNNNAIIGNCKRQSHGTRGLNSKLKRIQRNAIQAYSASFININSKIYADFRTNRYTREFDAINIKFTQCRIFRLKRHLKDILSIMQAK